MQTRCPRLIVTVRNPQGRILLYSGWTFNFVEASGCVSLLRARAPADCAVEIEAEHSALRQELGALGGANFPMVTSITLFPGKSPIIKQEPLEGGCVMIIWRMDAIHDHDGAFCRFFVDGVVAQQHSTYLIGVGWYVECYQEDLPALQAARLLDPFVVWPLADTEQLYEVKKAVLDMDGVA